MAADVACQLKNADRAAISLQVVDLAEMLVRGVKIPGVSRCTAHRLRGLLLVQPSYRSGHIIIEYPVIPGAECEPGKIGHTRVWRHQRDFSA